MVGSGFAEETLKSSSAHVVPSPPYVMKPNQFGTRNVPFLNAAKFFDTFVPPCGATETENFPGLSARASSRNSTSAHFPCGNAQTRWPLTEIHPPE